MDDQEIKLKCYELALTTLTSNSSVAVQGAISPTEEQIMDKAKEIYGWVIS